MCVCVSMQECVYQCMEAKRTVEDILRNAVSFRQDSMFPVFSTTRNPKSERKYQNNVDFMDSKPHHAPGSTLGELEQG